MTKVSAHFKRSEFACKCGCGFDAVDIELLGVLEDIRDYFNAPVTIVSGCRCKKHNKKIGGAKKSMHLWAKAADIRVGNISTFAVVGYLESRYSAYGIGGYSTWVHIDVREIAARWTKLGK